MATSGGVPLLDFSPIGSLADVYRGAQRERMKQDALKQFAQTQDPNVLAASGDPTLANLAMTYMQRKAQEQRQAAQDARQIERDKVQDARADRQFGATQAYQNRALALQERQLTEKPSIQKVKDAAGNESLVQVFPDGRTKSLTPGEAAAAAGGAGPNNPYAPDGKQTEGQANASLYARRMFNSEKILRDTEKEGTSLLQHSIANPPIPFGSKIVPDVAKNALHSERYQKFDQARRDFINATLRRESGAVISEAEFDNARKQYFPQPGDTKDVIAQKRRNRMEAIKGIAGAAGPAYRTPFTFDDAGNMQERASPGAKPAAGVVDWQTYFGAGQ